MNRFTSLPSGVLLLLAMVAVLGPAKAQTITLTPTAITDPNFPLTFKNVPVGATSQAQNISITSSASTTVVLQASNTSWLVFPNGAVYHPDSNGVSIPIEASAVGLAQGDYSGSFTVSVSQYVFAIVYVRMTVSGTSALSASPSSLFFSAQQGALGSSPASSVIRITSSNGAVGYTLSTQVQVGDIDWIHLSAGAGVSGFDTFLVQVDPSGLAAGTHTGSITALSNSSNDSATINVTLVVSPASSLTITPFAPAPVPWQVGTNDPAAQQFVVNSISGTVSFTARLSPLVTWATLSLSNGSASPSSPATLNVVLSPNLAGLTQGTYTTSLIVTPLGGSDLTAIPVTIVATTNPFVQLSPTSLTFYAPFGSAQSPPDQMVTITSSGVGAAGLTVTSDSSWLSATAASPLAPATLIVHVNPTGLAVGVVAGNLTVSPNNGLSSQKISVTLVVGSASQITVGPSQLLFSYQPGLAVPPVQTVQVRSAGVPESFGVGVATTSCGMDWLAATPSSNTTPATLAISVQPAFIAPASCQGMVTLSYNSANGPLTTVVFVTLAVAGNAELTVSMPAGFGDEIAQQGAGSYTRQVALDSTDPGSPVNFSASVFGGNWLSLSGNTTGATPQTLTIQVNPSALAGPGVFSGNLVITSDSLPDGSLTIPITLSVASASATVSPTSLSFSQNQGGPAPAAKTLTLSSSTGTGVFTSTVTPITGGSWITVSPNTGQANGTVQVSVLPNSLPQGDYQAQILFTFPNTASASITVNVTLHVAAPLRTVSVSLQSLNFSYQIGGSQPPAQTISVTSTGGPVDFAVGFTSSGWLSTDVSRGTTAKDVNVLVNTAGLTAAGSPYSGSISISAPGVLTNPVVVNVILVVTAAPVPIPMTIASNASGAFGAIAPGELITIKGIALGPDTPASGVLFSVNAQGNVDPILSGVRVLFSNIPGTPTYVSPGQINVIVPYEIEGLAATNVVVERDGVASAASPVAVAGYAPGLYTNNFAGTGQVTAVNQDGTLNGPAGGGFSPAAQGSVLTVYATGFGQTSPRSITGSVTPKPRSAADLLLVSGTVTATIGGQNAPVLFAGEAPGIVTGVVQINIKVPNGVSGDQSAILVFVNGMSTPLVGTTVAVQ